MYFSIVQGKGVHIVGPFRNVKEFLEWKKDENVGGQYRIVACQVNQDKVDFERQLESQGVLHG